MERHQLRTCGRCLFRNPRSGWCPKHAYEVSPEDPACGCFAGKDGLPHPQPPKKTISKLNRLISIMNPETENTKHEASMEAATPEAAQGTPVKKCVKCGRELPLDTFAPHNRAKDGHKSVCPDCEKAAKATRMPRPPKTGNGAPVKDSPLAGVSDKALVKELRDRGWEVSCKRTIIQEL